jgi:hypothetical protein
MQSAVAQKPANEKDRDSRPASLKEQIKDSQPDLEAEIGLPIFLKSASTSRPSINSEDDEFEREADRVADAVAQDSESTDLKPTPEALLKISPSKSESREPVFKSNDPGSALHRETRRRIESRTGEDLSHVRVHEDNGANHANKKLNSRAFAQGSNIWLGAGESQTDIKLMAHEATHVVQQGKSNSTPKIQRQQTAQEIAEELDLESISEDVTESQAQINEPQSVPEDATLNAELSDQDEDESSEMENTESEEDTSDVDAQSEGGETEADELVAEEVEAVEEAGEGGNNSDGEGDGDGEGRGERENTGSPGDAAQEMPSVGSDDLLSGLQTGEVALIDTELAEHQRWGAALERVGTAQSLERAEFVAEAAGGGLLGGLASGAAMGMGMGLVGRAAARFIPIPGVGGILSGAMSVYGLASRDWSATGVTISNFGEGASTYETLANSIAAIADIIDVVSNVLGVVEGIVGVLQIAVYAITAGAGIATVLTLGAAGPILAAALSAAETLTTIALALGVVTTALDLINAGILQPAVLLFRALHAFTSEADPREVEAQGADIGTAAGAIGGAVGGAIGARGAAVGGRPRTNAGDAPNTRPHADTPVPAAGGNGPLVRVEMPRIDADGPSVRVEAPRVDIDVGAPTAATGASRPAIRPPANPDAPVPDIPAAPRVPEIAPTPDYGPAPDHRPAVDPLAPTIPVVDPTGPTGRPPGADSSVPASSGDTPGAMPSRPAIRPPANPDAPVPDIPAAPRVPEIAPTPDYGPEPSSIPRVDPFAPTQRPSRAAVDPLAPTERPSAPPSRRDSPEPDSTSEQLSLPYPARQPPPRGFVDPDNPQLHSNHLYGQPISRETRARLGQNVQADHVIAQGKMRSMMGSDYDIRPQVEAPRTGQLALPGIGSPQATPRNYQNRFGGESSSALPVRPQDAANWSQVEGHLNQPVNVTNLPPGYGIRRDSNGNIVALPRNRGTAVDAEATALHIDDQGLIQPGSRGSADGSENISHVQGSLTVLAETGRISDSEALPHTQATFRDRQADVPEIARLRAQDGPRSHSTDLIDPSVQSRRRSGYEDQAAVDRAWLDQTGRAFQTRRMGERSSVPHEDVHGRPILDAAGQPRMVPLVDGQNRRVESVADRLAEIQRQEGRPVTDLPDAATLDAQLDAAWGETFELPASSPSRRVETPDTSGQTAMPWGESSLPANPRTRGGEQLSLDVGQSSAIASGEASSMGGGATRLPGGNDSGSAGSGGGDGPMGPPIIPTPTLSVGDSTSAATTDLLAPVSDMSASRLTDSTIEPASRSEANTRPTQSEQPTTEHTPQTTDSTNSTVPSASPSSPISASQTLKIAGRAGRQGRINEANRNQEQGQEDQQESPTAPQQPGLATQLGQLFVPQAFAPEGDAPTQQQREDAHRDRFAEDAQAGNINVERVNPDYPPPPGTPQQLEAIQQEIENILAARAQAEQAEAEMESQEQVLETDQTPIQQAIDGADGGITAVQAHQEAVTRRGQSNQEQQQRQQETGGLVSGYPSRAAGLATLTIPLDIFAGFTSLGSHLPGDAGAKMREMNQDAVEIQNAFTQMGVAMVSQEEAQPERQTELSGQQSRIEATDAEATATNQSIEQSRQDGQVLQQENEAQLAGAKLAKSEASDQGRILDEAVATKQTQADSLTEQLQAWAVSHKATRHEAIEATAAQLEADGYVVLEKNEG